MSTNATAKKPVWEEGTVYVKYTDKDGAIHYEEHRCWNMSGFLRNCARRAMEEKGTAEAVSEKTYKRWQQLNRRHR